MPVAARVVHIDLGITLATFVNVTVQDGRAADHDLGEYTLDLGSQRSSGIQRQGILADQVDDPRCGDGRPFGLPALRRWTGRRVGGSSSGCGGLVVVGEAT